MKLDKIPLYYQSKKFRVDEVKKKFIWIERLNELGEPTEDYTKVNKELFCLLAINNQIDTSK